MQATEFSEQNNNITKAEIIVISAYFLFNKCQVPHQEVIYIHPSL